MNNKNNISRSKSVTETNLFLIKHSMKNNIYTLHSPHYQIAPIIPINSIDTGKLNLK